MNDELAEFDLFFSKHSISSMIRCALPTNDFFHSWKASRIHCEHLASLFIFVSTVVINGACDSGILESKKYGNY